MSKELDLSGNGSPAVRTHCRYDKRLCPCISKPLTGCANNNGKVADAAAAGGDRYPHAWFNNASQSSQLALCRGRRVILRDALEDLAHAKKAREWRCERELSSGFKEA
jgi:hypothetical protein